MTTLPANPSIRNLLLGVCDLLLALGDLTLGFAQLAPQGFIFAKQPFALRFLWRSVLLAGRPQISTLPVFAMKSQV